MSGRTPSFIVVGLVIIMFLLGLFYMSCSSKNTELRLSLEQFEERYRSLTLKNSDSEKKYENLNSRKRELEEEKVNVQRQMEKKDSEINDLNTKLNEKLAEVKTLQTDKKVLDEQLKDYKSLSETIASKNTLIEKLQKQLSDQKQTDAEQITRLKREYDTLKNNSASSSSFAIPPQRFRPLETNNYTTKSIASLLQEAGNKLNNLTKEVKAQIVPAVVDMKDKVLNAIGLDTNSTTTLVANQEQQNQQQVGQNVPAPPLADAAQQKQQPDHVESAQAAPQLVDNNPAAVDNSQYQNKLQRSLTKSLSDNGNVKALDMKEDDDEQELNFDNNAQENRNRPRQIPMQGNDGLNDAPSPLGKANRKNYRIVDREQFRKDRVHMRQEQPMDNAEEVDAREDNEEDRQIRKRNAS